MAWSLALVGLLLSRSSIANRVDEDDHDTYELHAGLVRAHSLAHAQELARAGLTAPLAPDVRRPFSDLYDDVPAMAELMTRSRKHTEIYEGLLASMIRKRGESPGNFEQNRKKQVEYVKSLYEHLLCDSAEESPQVVFVLGGVAVGKSTFVRSKVSLAAGTVHINADDIRSLLVGNYGTYSLMTGNGEDASLMRFAPTCEAAKDANTVRFYVQSVVLNRKCNFLADSLSVPAKVVNDFVDAGYNAHVYYLEIGFKGSRFEGQEADYDKKVELSRERIRNRISSGGHASSNVDLMSDGFIKKLRNMVATMALNLKVTTPFYISQDGDYELVEWPSVLEMEAKTSVD